MLKTRILTAAILIGFFLSALFYFPSIFWGILLLALTVTAAYEWCKQQPHHETVHFVFDYHNFARWRITTVAERSVVHAPNYSGMLGSTPCPAFLGDRCTNFAGNSTSHQTPSLLMLSGWLVLLPTCMAMYQLRAIDPWLLLGLMGVVWISDSAAYFTGRAFGKHKLAPSISPGKTWEGVAGALVAVFCYALMWGLMAEKAYGFSVIGLILLSLILTALGIVGDLFESLMKRHAGVKDSGNILPGHGGILDRIDALTSTLPVAILVFLIINSLEL